MFSLLPVWLVTLLPDLLTLLLFALPSRSAKVGELLPSYVFLSLVELQASIASKPLGPYHGWTEKSH